MNVRESIKGTVFEKVRDEYYAGLPSDEAKDTMMLKILYVLLSR